MYPEITLLMEKPLNSLCQAMPHPGHCADAVSAWPQVRDCAQVLKTVRLGCNGIGFWIFNPTGNIDLVGMQFHGLPFAGRGDDFTTDTQCATCGQMHDLAEIIREIIWGNDLQRIKTRTIVERNEGQSGLRIATSPHPTLHSDSTT